MKRLARRFGRMMSLWSALIGCAIVIAPGPRLATAQSSFQSEDPSRLARRELVSATANQYILSTESKHKSSLRRTGIDDHILAAPMHIPLHPITNLMLDFDARHITLGQWLAMMIEADASMMVTTTKAFWQSGFQVHLKSPGVVTSTLTISPDGSDWFITRLRQGETEITIPQDQYAILGSLFDQATNFSTILLGRVQSQTSR